MEEHREVTKTNTGSGKSTGMKTKRSKNIEKSINGNKGVTKKKVEKSI